MFMSFLKEPVERYHKLSHHMRQIAIVELIAAGAHVALSVARSSVFSRAPPPKRFTSTSDTETATKATRRPQRTVSCLARPETILEKSTASLTADCHVMGTRRLRDGRRRVQLLSGFLYEIKGTAISRRGVWFTQDRVGSAVWLAHC
jgi:hypothetical protein